ncbi:hypothetical protein [Streptomyces sp. ALI-76-A]|uniref:hypothetical protein n=1 Tax=Streptomyces sp. ALI-76-A TaxID=3025736 RepID=UPI00256F6124|nr:hypothetical protein [Streptomyces sp. ALI-76-A]MDL5203204.1 hypothetical protein [Streptomyces sp. ALI-76-A]
MTDVRGVRGEALAGCIPAPRAIHLGAFTTTGLVPGTVTLAVNSPEHRPLALPVEIGGTGVFRVAILWRIEWRIELRPGAEVRDGARPGRLAGRRGWSP